MPAILNGNIVTPEMLVLPSNMVIKKGDFKGIVDGYFLVTDTYSKRQVVGSVILKEFSDLVHKTTVFWNDNTFNNEVKSLLGSYGIYADIFGAYVYLNRRKILDAIGEYMVVQDLIAQYEKLAKIRQGHSVGEFIDYIGDKIKGGTTGILTGISDVVTGTLGHVLKSLLPILAVVILFIVAASYGYKKIKQNAA